VIPEFQIGYLTRRSRAVLHRRVLKDEKGASRQALGP
jgi:hypothetical protein